MTTCLTLEEAALQAASQTTKAAAELLQFHRDGPHSAVSAFANDVVGPMAEALKLVLEIEPTEVGQCHMEAAELQLHLDLKAALDAFLIGWIG